MEDWKQNAKFSPRIFAQPSPSLYSPTLYPPHIFCFSLLCGVMAYSFSETLESLPTPLQKLAKEPVWWAFLGSLGIHGIIFAVMPFVSLSTPLSDESEIQREVSVIELEPGDLERVPDFSESQIEIPAIPDADDFYDDDFYSFDFGDQDDALDEFDNTVPPLAAPPPLDFSWPLPPPPITFNPTPPAPTPPTPAPSEPSPDSITAPTEPLPTPEETLDPPQDSPVSPDVPPQTPEADSPDAPPQQSVTERLLAEQAELQELFTFNGEGTTQEDANLAFGAWFYEGLGKNLEELQQVELTPPFPAIACPIWKGDDIAAVYGATVDANGVPAEDPVLIQSAGYEFFNREALKAIQQAEIPNESGEGQAFLITVRFVYDEAACPIDTPEDEAVS